QEGTDDVQQAHGQSHHGLGDNVGRGDDGRHKEDQNDHDAPGALHQRGADNAHPGQDHHHQRHLKDGAEDQEDGDTEADIAGDTGGLDDVVGTFQVRHEVEHEGQGDEVGE